VTLDAPKLSSVGGNLYIESNVTLPKLSSVGGNLYIQSNVTLDAPKLSSVGGNLSIESNVTFKNPLTKGLKYKSVDRSLFVIESEKTSKGIKIYSGYNIFGIKKGKAEKKYCYVAENGEYFAHGETVKKAIQDLQLKLISEKLKNEPIKKDTVIDIKYYRLITGACEIGVKEWMKHNDMKKESYTASELLPILKKTNAYGLEKFKSLITF
jgi:hypothetical protein